MQHILVELLDAAEKTAPDFKPVVSGAHAITHLIGAILLEQNDERTVQLGRYLMLETTVPLSDNTVVRLITGVARHSGQPYRRSRAMRSHTTPPGTIP